MPPTFAELGVPAPLCARLAELEINEPFPVQAATIPDALAGRDVCGKAPTGSGKTIAFGLPLPGGGQRRQRPLDLGGELPGRGEDEGAGLARLGPGDPGDERDPEGQGLPRAGGSPAADVAAGQRGGDRRRLDGERLGDALLGEARGDVGGDAEVGERDRQEGTPVLQGAH